MSETGLPLRFAVRPRVLLKYLGQIGVAVGVLTLVPMVAAWLGGQPHIAIRYGVVAMAFGAGGACGAALRSTDRMQPNEAMVISALVFLLTGLAMAFPITGYGVHPLDAIFESVSAVTTTGLSTLDTLAPYPPAFFFGRAWLQWVGGLGVVVLALAVVIPSGVAAKHLGFGEHEAADFVGGTRAHARRLIVVYLGLTAGGFGLCLASGLGWFDALAHALAAVSTGGFATSDASLAEVPRAAQAAVSLTCLAGAVSFSLYYTVFSNVRVNPVRVRTLLLVILAGAVGLATSAALSDWSGMTAFDAVWMTVSAQTTAGFSTLDVSALPATAKLILIGEMFVGGEVGSTAGGLKILRLLILLKLVGLRVRRLSLPVRSHLPLRFGGARVGRRELEDAAGFVAVYAAVAALAWAVFVAYGVDPLTALFDVVSSLSTAGLSSGAIHGELAPILKVVTCATMLIGRVEVFAFLVLVYPGTWIGKRRSAS